MIITLLIITIGVTATAYDLFGKYATLKRKELKLLTALLEKNNDN